MDASQQESLLKKKLQGFLAEMLKMGSVKGFKHFVTYLRGREEMVTSVVNGPQSPTNSYSSETPTPIRKEHRNSESFTSQNLPYDKRSLMLSQRTQMTLSGYGDRGVGLPPASPSDEESLARDENSTVFLIAGYTRYCCPYVWVRSNHERLIKMTGDKSERDSPLRLKSTSKWKDTDMYIWDVIAELVKLCTYPAPRNPFAVDLDFFNSLPLTERVLATAAMMNCLQKILLHTSDDKQYAGKVLEDLQLISKCHFSALQKLVKNQGLPILQQHLQRQQQQQVKSSSQPRRQRYPSTGSQYNTPHYGDSYNTGTQYNQYNQSKGNYENARYSAAPSRF